MADKFIRVRGARMHNLKGVDLDIPRERFVVISGLSGSGKSSLAFDTLYAEGRRKYVESLSVHARQYLEQLEKPEVDHIEGLPPTLAIEQRTSGAGPRSTVGTVTEIHDYLRLLFARTGTPHCPGCGKPISRRSASQIVDDILTRAEGTRFLVLAPLVRGLKGDHKEVIRRIRRDGFVRVRVNGETADIQTPPKMDKRRKHTVEAVVDRLVLRTDIRPRLTDSIELALRTSQGSVTVSFDAGAGVWTDAAYSDRFACPDCGISFEPPEPRMFSFNNPHGACPECAGLGTVAEFDPELVVPDLLLSLDGGAVRPWMPKAARDAALYRKAIEQFCDDFGVDPAIPFSHIDQKDRDLLLTGGERGGKTFEGVLPNLKRRWREAKTDSVRNRLAPYLSEQTCPTCKGARLRPEALAVKIALQEDRQECLSHQPPPGGTDIPVCPVASVSIDGLCSIPIDDLAALVDRISLDPEKRVIADPILTEVRRRLAFLVDVGVGYLSLNRSGATLSGGEFQRIRLAGQVGSGLTGVCYVLDEPTIGLHQRDNRRLIDTLRRMVDAGNSLLVVEHDEDTVRSADWVIDIGPGAGSAGGRVVAQGTVEQILADENSPTGNYLSGRLSIPVPATRRPTKPDRELRVVGARANNLANLEVAFPLGVLLCVTGVSGSGKSTLVNEVLLRGLKRKLSAAREKPGEHDKLLGANLVERVIEVDQAPIGRSPRSNPATYCGVFDLIRTVFAKTKEAKLRGYASNRFSFNTAGGRCEGCRGQGVKRIEMHFLADVFVECAECRGTRYSRETLEIRWRGRNIAEVLAMRVEEAVTFFDAFSDVKERLAALDSVGLGYLALGQSAAMLSGGEAQRVKLAAELGRGEAGRTLYILDEPTTGLHFADIRRLMTVLDRLVELGNSVIVIEHNLDVIKGADWVIDLGPEGGAGGGRILVEGTPETVAACEASHTGRHLREKLEEPRTK